MFRRRHVQADDVCEFLDELRIARDPEAADQLRFQPVVPPVPPHGVWRHVELGRHRAGVPVHGRRGRALGGRLHQARQVHLHRRCAARQVTFDAGETRLPVTLAPARYLHAADYQLRGDLLVLQPLRRRQDDPRAVPGSRWSGENATASSVAPAPRRSTQ